LVAGARASRRAATAAGSGLARAAVGRRAGRAHEQGRAAAEEA
jgi:hypothetical protein